MQCSATDAMWFSIFFEKVFVRRVNRRMDIRMVRFCRSYVRSADVLRVGIADPSLLPASRADHQAVPLLFGGIIAVHLDQLGIVDIRTEAIGNRRPGSRIGCIVLKSQAW